MGMPNHRECRGATGVFIAQEVLMVMGPAVYPPARESSSPFSRGPSRSTRWMAVLLLLVAGALVYTVVRGRGSSVDTGGSGSIAAEPRAITPRGDLSSDEQSTIAVLGREWELLGLDEVLDGDEAGQLAVPVDDRQLLNLVAAQQT